MTTGGGDKDLADNTVPELRQACGRRGLRSYGRLRKADLIGLLEGARAKRTIDRYCIVRHRREDVSRPPAEIARVGIRRRPQATKGNCRRGQRCYA